MFLFPFPFLFFIFLNKLFNETPAKLMQTLNKLENNVILAYETNERKRVAREIEEKVRKKEMTA